jgi:hypothetical protein
MGRRAALSRPTAHSSIKQHLIFPKTCENVFILVGHWWIIPIILATQKTAIRRITVQSQPRK